MWTQRYTSAWQVPSIFAQCVVKSVFPISIFLGSHAKHNTSVSQLVYSSNDSKSEVWLSESVKEVTPSRRFKWSVIPRPGRLWIRITGSPNREISSSSSDWNFQKLFSTLILIWAHTLSSQEQIICGMSGGILESYKTDIPHEHWRCWLDQASNNLKVRSPGWTLNVWLVLSLHFHLKNLLWPTNRCLIMPESTNFSVLLIQVQASLPALAQSPWSDALMAWTVDEMIGTRWGMWNGMCEDETISQLHVQPGQSTSFLHLFGISG